MEILILLVLVAPLLIGWTSLYLFKRTHHSPYIGLARSSDVILGSTTRLLSTPLLQVRLGKTEQKYHAVIFGRSGSGKSKLLQSVFLQHLKQGQGVGLLEPHHDLSFDCLTSLIGQGFFKDPNAYKKLIYLDWGNGAFVPFNVLAGSGDHHTIALNALDAMLRVWPELAQAPLFQTLFLSSILVLIANTLPITFLYKLLTDAEWRALLLKRVVDPLVLETFANYDKLGARDQPQAAGSTLRRAFLLSFSPIARLSLGHPENLLPFRRWMDEGVSFIVNLGKIGDPETRKLIGAFAMVGIEQAVLSRSNLPPSQRTPCTLLVDEWPAFAAQEKTISDILSQTRKFNLRLYLAAQSLSQVDSSRLVGALENCRLQIVFGLGRDSAAAQSKYIGSADPFLVKEPGRGHSQHAQYLSIVEQYESWAHELQNLPPRMAYAKLEDCPAVKIRTLEVPALEPDSDKLAEVLDSYRAMYQRSQEEAEQAIAKLDSPTAKPARVKRTVKR